MTDRTTSRTGPVARARRLARHVAAAAVWLAGAGLIAAPVAAQQAAGALPRIAHEKYVLPNGLEVILHVDRSTPVVTVNTYYKVGSGHERPGRTGFAHLFEHVMFMGSEHVPVGAFDQWLEAAGANNNGYTTNDRTVYYEDAPSNALALALWLDADRMGYLLPTMDQAKLDLQRGVVQNERRQSYDNRPYGRSWETIIAALFPTGHPHSWPTIGSMSDLQAAALDDVKGFFRTYYAPNNATIVVAGDFDTDSAKAYVQRFFGPIPRGPVAVTTPVPPATRLAADTFMVMEDRVQLPRVYSAWRTTKAFGPDDAALDVLAYVLGGDRTSRLYQKLVYETQLAQDAGAGHNSELIDGSFVVQVTPKPGRTPAELSRLVDAEIARLARDGITGRELERARNTRRSQMLSRLAGVNGKADQLNYYNYYVGQPDYAQDDYARFDRVTAADVQRVAQQYLRQPRVTLTVVPEGKRNMMVTQRGGTP